MTTPPENPITPPITPRGRFWRIASAGIFFQGGAAVIEVNTIIAGLVHGLTGSVFAVGAAASITRYGWLFPQIFVAFLAQRRRRRMPFYVFGGLGRAACLVAIAALLGLGAGLPGTMLVAGFFVLWTLYGFISGVVAVPYNDMVARAVPSSRRSRLLAVRFFGGGVLALGAAAAAHGVLNRLDFHSGYGAVVLLAAVVMTISAVCFMSAREDDAPLPAAPAKSFTGFLGEGVAVLRRDRIFRRFLYVQWLGGAVNMALPFYILQVAPGRSVIAFAGILLAAQTAGGLVSNPLWGWWGDVRGKLSLLRLVSALNGLAPVAALAWIAGAGSQSMAVPWFAAVFFVLGAVGNGRTIAYLGYLMEISPDDRRPAYSGCFNALVAPAALLPMAGAGLAAAFSFAAVFAAALVAALVQVVVLWRLRVPGAGGAP